MRIALVTLMPPHPRGPGAIPRLLDAQLGVLRERHELTLICPVGGVDWEAEAVELLHDDGVDVRAVSRDEPLGVGDWGRRARLARLWGVRRLPWRTAWFWDEGVQAAYDARLAEGPVDVVQVEDNAMGVYRYRGAAVTVLTEHEVRRDRPLRLATDPRGLVWEVDWHRWAAYQRRVWRRFDRVQVFTDRDAALAGAMVPEMAGRLRVNPFAVDVPEPPDAGDQVAGTVLFMGNFSHPPNVDAAVWLAGEIMPVVRRRHPAARLVVLGDQAPPAVRDLAGPGVEVLGRVPEVRPFIASAQVVAAPVRIGGGMRMKVLEALISGKPVVTTTRGREGMEEAPLECADDVDGLAAAIAGLLGDDARRTRLGAAAREYAVTRHHPEAYVDRLEAVWREALIGEVARV